MMRSMFSGISGLRSHQTMMDVVGNNIANVNTAGFKASVVTFEEALSQTLSGAGTSSSTQGGANAIQIGLGTKVSSIDGVFTQGASQVTGRTTDLAIQGDGFFVLDDGGTRTYTRAGNFNFDGTGTLTAPGGARVMGWTADATGAIDFSLPTQPLTIPLTAVLDPVETTTVDVGGNLPADAATGDTVTTTMTVFDSLGNPSEMVLTWTKNAAANTWDMDATIGGTTATMSGSQATFDAAGQLTSASPVTLTGVTPAGANPLTIDLVFDGSSPLVQFGGSASAAALGQDGSAIGSLRDVSIGSDGTISGQFSNGSTRVLGAVATTSFTNPAGLLRVGDSRFEASVNSGDPQIGRPGTGSRGSLSAGTLEMSNVDLAAEFTNMIIAQRGFQANSRIITASDEILSDLVNMKR